MNNPLELRPTRDGSLSAYNSTYQDCYHSMNDGAILETLYKHVISAFSAQERKCTLRILDICFGLGYNSLFSLAYAQKYHFDVKIYSPEKDLSLLDCLQVSQYPRILQNYLEIEDILHCIQKNHEYRKNGATLRVFRGDARDYMESFESGFFDVIYQDAFSPNKNRELWSEAHFCTLYRILNDEGIITTYSSAKHIRETARLCGFHVYAMKTACLKVGSIFMKTKPYFKNLDVVHVYDVD